MRIPALLAAFLLAFPALAHPPSGGTKDLPPTKAEADLKEARRLFDAEKQRLTDAGKYNCCIGPPEGSKVAGCDLCLRHGECPCGTNLAAGKPVCGQCTEVLGLPPLSRKRDKEEGVEKRETPLIPLAGEGPGVREMRDALNRAKRTLVSEGRYTCCIGDGGCDECAFEAYCPCGVEVNKPKGGEGVCGSCYDGWHEGKGLYPDIALVEIHIAPMETMSLHAMAGMTGMTGMLGDWSMNREASGTSWLPDSSPMYAKMSSFSGLTTMVHGYGYGVYSDQGGKRGDTQFSVPNQLMGMAWKRTSGLIIGGRLMVSADANLMGVKGYPLLFQTGETAYGKPLVDRQHPHDGIMELAATVAKPLNEKGASVSLYLAPIGEPALGPPAFPHRPSAMDNPEAPLGHHWFDATHIASGVATLGITPSNRYRVEGSVFNGREPDEDRWRGEKLRWNSYSGRFSVNPSRDLTAQVSYAFLKSPEVLEPNTNQNRTTVSLTHNRPQRDGRDNWQTTAAWARNHKTGEETRSTDAYLLESSYLTPSFTLFGRVERTDKDELLTTSHNAYTVDKFTLGGVKNVLKERGTEIGVGGSVSLYSFPGALEPVYGSRPVSFTLFVRVRTERM